MSKDPDVQYDAVTTLAVIEHVADVNDFVRRLKGWCRPGGTIIILTCNESGLIYHTARLLNSIGFPSAFNRLYSRHHLNHFNVKSLRTLLTNNGLLVRHTILHNMPLSAFDSPSATIFGHFVSLFTVAVLFLLGTITNRSFFQTVTCYLPED
jgi:SAM-dependent methyltransferase